MRAPLVAGNWKMFKGVADAVAYAKEFRSLAKDVTTVELVIAPPFTAVHAVADALRNSGIATAGQDCFWEQEGAFTGAVSARMLAEAGAALVIIGHAERRRVFGDTDADVSRKIHAAYAAGLAPIACIGETLEEREAGRTFDVLDTQLKAAIEGLTGEQFAKMVIAYEPVWAIGTGRNATPEQAQEAHAHIRGRLRAWLGADAADKCQILYGGSVKPDNARAILQQPDVDGALVGGASLDPQGFFAICAAAI
ncbi:MAG: triose-phosphate isomerase [Acidobacteria bacterium]|nr:triose-phosphate isomerase [Acidobacteriota bacterium]